MEQGVQTSVSYQNLQDCRLVELSLQGDTSAFGALFERYRDGVRMACLQMAGNADDADDIMQDTFVKAFRNLGRYDAAHAFGQWIHSIARNTFIDQWRRRRDDVSLSDFPDWVTPSAAVDASSPERCMIDSQSGQQLMEFLSRMQPNYRRLMELRFLREYSYEEIAAELNLPLGTVKTQIHRARRQLCGFIESNEMLN